MTDYQILPAPLVTHAGLRGRVFTSNDAGRFGIHEFGPALAAEECFRIRPGLYSLEPELDAAGRVWAGLLIAGDGAALGREAAEWVRGQGPEPEVVDVWCGTRNLKDRGPWRFHKGEPEDVQSREAINETFGKLLVSRELDTKLAQKLAGRSLRLADRERFLRLCVDPPSEGRSVFEATFNRDVMLAHGLPLLDWTPLEDSPHVVAATLFGVDVNLHLNASLPHRNLNPYYSWDRHNRNNDDPDQPQLLSWSDVVEDPCLVAGKVARRLRARAWQGEVLDCRRCTTSPSTFSMMRDDDRRSLTECPTCGSQLVQLWRMPEHREAVSR